MLQHMENTGAQIEICVHEVVWRVKNNRKPKNFRDVLYRLNVTFLQCIFDSLKSIFSNSKKKKKNTRTECDKAHFVFASQIKELG
jgi:hypothetical protein